MAGDFSDEEWDISDDQLQVLEQNAILSTQQQDNQESKTHSLSSNAHSHLIDKHRSTGPTLHRAVSALPPHLNKENRSSPSIDEDGVPLVVEQQRAPYVSVRRTDETTQREQWRANRFGAHINQQPPVDGLIPMQAHREHQQRNQPVQRFQHLSAPSIGQQTIDTTSQNDTQHVVQTSMSELQRERDLLKKSLDDITKQLHTARGENVVVRSKGANDLKLAERQIQILKKQMQEEALKHQATLQSKEAAYTKLATDSNFLKHDLDEQSRKVKTLQVQLKEKPSHYQANGLGLSPRKAAANNIRDGFDDDELMLMSPGRSPAKGNRSKPSTPTNRKRKQADINVAPLPLRLSGDLEQAGNTNNVTGKGDPVLKVIKNAEVERHFKFVQDILNFHPLDGQDTTVEALVKFAFPSESTRPLSSLLLIQISDLQGSRIPGDLLQFFAKLLDSCAKEEYYKPLSLLLTIIDRILDIEPSVVDGDILRNLLPPLQGLIEVNARRRWNLADITKVWDSRTHRPLPDTEIDTALCLEILVIVANLVTDEPDLIKLFWSTLTSEFILIMATSIHPIRDLTLVLELLETSILETTFGNICKAEEQNAMEIYVIDKVCFLLWEPPRHILLTRQDKKATIAVRENSTRKRGSKGPPNQQSTYPVPQPTSLEICNLRLATLSLLSKLVMTSMPHPHNDPALTSAHYGTNMAVTHPKLVARLTRSIYDEITSLYAHHPETHDLHATLVNRATAILHHILMSAPAKNIDLPNILLGTSVGIHKFRVAMCRLAFRDGQGGGIDEGISEETVGMAEEILAEYVTPDEAMQLFEAFGKTLVDEDADMDAEDEETLAAEADNADMIEVTHIDDD